MAKVQPVHADVIGATTADVEAAERGGDAQTTKPPKPPTVPISKLFVLATGPELCLLFGGILGAIVNGAYNPAMIYAWGRMIDGIGGADGVNMSDQLLLMCMVGVAALIAAGMQAFCLRTFALRQSMKLRKKYYEAILNKDISWFDERTPAALPGELNSDSDMIVEAFADKFGMGISGMSGFLMCIIFGFVLGWHLALAILAAVPLMAIGMVIFGKAIQEVTQETQSWYSDAGAIIEETLFALRTVVSLGGERREIDRYSDAVKKAQIAARRNEFKIATGMAWTESVFALCTAGAFYLGMILIYEDVENPATGAPYSGGDVLIIFFMVLTAGFLIGQTEPMAKALSEGQVAMARFLKVLETKSEITSQGAETRTQITSFESFEFRDVHFSYPTRLETTVLKGVSFKIEKGQKVAFVGESGSGKSTVMSLLERFYDPTKGFVLVNGEDLKTISPAALRSLIGYVGQEPVLFATTIRHNIMQGSEGAKAEDLEKACKVAQLGFVDSLPEKLETFVGSGGSQFSGGQKQRIAIARAMLRHPKILFLDEATSALDVNSESLIQETLETISAKGIDGEPLTTVAIAHRLRTIKTSHRIYVLKDGMIAEQGTHEELTSKDGGLYQALAATQTMRTNAVSPRGETTSSAGGANDLDGATQPDAAATSAPETKDEKDKGDEKKAKVSMLRLQRFCKPEWPFYIPGILGALVHGAATPLQGWLTVEALDAFYAPKEVMKDQATDTTIYFLIVGICLFIFESLQFGSFGVIAEAMCARLRIALVTHIFRQEIGFHDDPDHTPALLGTALQFWAYRVKNLNNAISSLFEVVGSLGAGFTIAFAGSWQMSLAMLGAIPVLAAASTIQMAFMAGGTSMANDDMKLAQQVVSDSVQNVRTVHAIGCGPSLVETYDERVHKANAGYWWKSMISGAAFGFGLSAPCFVMAFGFWYSDKLMKDGDADFKGVMMSFMGILYAGMAAGQAMGKLGDFAKAQAAYKDIFGLLDRESAIDGLEPKGTVPSWAAVDKEQAGSIEFREVAFAYPFRKEALVLKSVSFTIEAGSSVGLVGPSGGGKSTIIALLQRFYDPSQGQVFISGARTDLSTVDIRWWRKQIGYVGQEPILFDSTVKANILYSLDAEGAESLDPKDYDKYKALAKIDFADDIVTGPRGSRLSGGQKQRVAICRALARDPPILLFDEATSALDSESEKIVQQALDSVSIGRTSITIAHRLSTIQNSDKILVAGEGRILEVGTHDELVASGGVYYKLWHGTDAQTG